MDSMSTMADELLARTSSCVFTNDVIVNHIFPFCEDVKTALSLSEVNRAFWSASQNDTYWTSLSVIGKVWQCSESEEKLLETPQYLQNCPHNFNKDENETNVVLLSDRVTAMSMSELRRSLALCKVDTSNCIEKSDYRRHLKAALIFESSFRESKAMATRRTLLNFPEWALGMSEGKATYYHALRESARKLITRGELLTAKWKFWFKYAQDQFGNVALAEAFGPVQKFDIQFFDDDTLTSSMHNNQRMRYTFELMSEEGSVRSTGYRSIRVEQYPELTLSRLPSGMWQMENQNVIMEQVDPIRDIPLL